jgi:Uncharacterized protein conserved in bacteria (DUF2252)
MSVLTAEAAPRRVVRYQLDSGVGGSDVFDRAIAQFATTYADQNERDHQALVDAVTSGKLTA